MLDAMRPFVIHLLSQGLEEKTFRSHMDKLWLLGGEIIRLVSMFDQYDMAPEENLRRHVEDEGGPYCCHLHSESQRRSYDSTCRRLCKFLEETKRRGQKGVEGDSDRGADGVHNGVHVCRSPRRKPRRSQYAMGVEDSTEKGLML